MKLRVLLYPFVVMFGFLGVVLFYLAGLCELKRERKKEIKKWNCTEKVVDNLINDLEKGVIQK